jgi:AbrB family looped-hinge helix DNA binding protein
MLHGFTTVGERGQIVIPHNIRTKLKIKAGDEMVVLAKAGKIIVLPARKLEAFYRALLGRIDSLLQKKKR